MGLPLPALRVLNPELAEALVRARPASHGGCRPGGRRAKRTVAERMGASARELTERILAKQQACCAECAAAGCSDAGERAAPAEPMVPTGPGSLSFPASATSVAGTLEKKRGKSQKVPKSDDPEDDYDTPRTGDDGSGDQDDSGDGEGGDDGDDGDDAGDDGGDDAGDDGTGADGGTTAEDHSWCEAASNDQQTCHWFDDDGCVCTDNSTYDAGGPHGSSSGDWGPDFGDPSQAFLKPGGGGFVVQTGPGTGSTQNLVRKVVKTISGALTLAELLLILGISLVDIDDSPEDTDDDEPEDGVDPDPDDDDQDTDCASLYPGYPECWEEENGDWGTSVEDVVCDSGDVPDHYNAFVNGQFQESIICCPCCEDNEPAELSTRCRASYTTNV